MKKLVVFLVIAMAVTMVNAQNVDFDKLRATHITAMKYYGHSPMLQQKNLKMAFLPCGNIMASACYGEDMATAYMEKGNHKFYWYVKKVEGGLLLTIKVNINGSVHTRTFKITRTKSEVRFQDLDWQSGENARLSIDWDCVKRKAPQCIACLINWVCWLGCAGNAILSCVDW